MPEVLIKAGRSLTVYTYKAEGSPMFAYLKRLGLNTRHDRLDPEVERAFKADARKRITVKKIRALDGVGLSYTAQTGKKASPAKARRVNNALRSMAQNALKDVPRDHILVTCPKVLWHLDGVAPDLGNDGEEVMPFRPGPYAKGSRLAPTGKDKTRAIWIPNTTRGTNDHAHCTHAIYLYDQYLNPIVHRWIGGNEVISEDDYALTELVQWVWRTAVRRGGEITLYLPSKRMRELFLGWLWDGKVPTSVRDEIEGRHQRAGRSANISK